MDDWKIMELSRHDREAAMEEARSKYGDDCLTSALHILSSRQSAQECVEDALHSVWDRMSEERGDSLGGCLRRITREFALERWYQLPEPSRTDTEVFRALEELSECTSGADAHMARPELAYSVNQFLAALPGAERSVFVSRYFDLMPLAEIAEQYQLSEPRARSTLYRTRLRLREYLQKEEYR